MSPLLHASANIFLFWLLLLLSIWAIRDFRKDKRELQKMIRQWERVDSKADDTNP